ncbi:DMT family transporter [Paraflavitalea pollutisoli]|uniref:DMT family transporter n=1 Tax=Paraflavitalea pollutisoli TaxID=3034143 RepID=UPI0023EB41DB|nr:DMT family transporter [Paraflavitalea sp. H1-2-19X]
MTTGKKELFIGIGLAVLATIVWSGNFVVARGVIHQIPPVSLAFYRWATASLILLPFAWKKFQVERPLLLQHKSYLFWTALSGITLFNTFVYVAGHHSPAINLALIGTTTSPIFSLVLAAIFLKEAIKPLRIIGVVLCIAGILYLLSQGSWERLKAFHFSAGDGWILVAALTFAIYNIFVRRKPAGIHPINFLFTIFALGTLLLLPAYVIELSHTPPVQWTTNLVLIILYLGAGASVLAFLCWNIAIGRLGAARTALFGNLIPIFSILEAVWFLGETFTMIHALSGLLVVAGVLIANLKK